MEHAQQIIGANERVQFTEDQYQACDGADALVIVTEWKTFKSPNFDRLKQEMKNSLIFDGRNIYDPVLLKESGFHYHGIGRSSE